jgi:alpha-tubulin suppressor-like RCC1 family protein
VETRPGGKPPAGPTAPAGESDRTTFAFAEAVTSTDYAHRMRKNLSLTAIIGGLGVLLGNILAQDLTITQASFTESGSFQVRFAAETNGVYFRLLAAGSPIENYSLVGVWVPNSSLPLLTDPQPEIAARFYRVDALPLDAATDTDSDGMPDWFELRHFPQLDVADPTDSFEDLDDDGRSNLTEFSAGSNALVAEPDIVPFAAPQHIAANSASTLAIDTAGTLWGWGLTRSPRFEMAPRQLGFDTDWATVTIGTGHGVGLRRDGALWEWGGDDSNPLGLDLQTGQFEPHSVMPEHRWKAAAAGSSHTLAIRNDGTLWGWGSNGFGQVGGEASKSISTPSLVSAETNRLYLGSASTHSLALKADGSLWSWGNAAWGALGHSTNAWSETLGTPAVVVPTRVGHDRDWRQVGGGDSFSVGLRRDGSLWICGTDLGGSNASPTMRQLLPGSRWKSFAAGSQHLLAIRDDGSIWSGGRGTAKGEDPEQATVELARLLKGPSWRGVYGRFGHSLALKEDGQLVAWGRNQWGQLGIGSTNVSTLPQQIGSGTNWIAVTAGEYHTMGLRSDGSLWSWGRGIEGQLGVSTNLPRPVSLTTRLSRYSPQRIDAAFDWVAISAGDYHSAALRRDGSLWTWGRGGLGQLGVGIFSTNHPLPARVVSELLWKKLSAGGNRTMVIASDGSLWGCGDGSFGFGDGTSRGRPALTQLGLHNDWQEIQIGGAHSLGLRRSGSLWAWGFGSASGTGTTADRLAPTPVAPEFIWVELACDGTHSLAIRSDGTLWGWGYNRFAQLGISTPLENQLWPLQIEQDTSWQGVAAGELHSLGIRTDGTLWSWGDNLKGQLGRRGNSSRPAQVGTARWKAVAAGEYHTVAIQEDGSLWAWGDNYQGQLGNLSPYDVLRGKVWNRPPQ